MADNLVRDPSGKIWEERGGKWYEVSGARGGGMLAGADMGPGEALLVGAGRELTRLGRGARSLFAQATGDDATVKRLAGQEEEASAQIAGSSAAGPGGMLAVGGMLPGLATLPIGLGVGGAASRGLGALAEQVAISGGMGGIGHSGDQGMDAMTGALLGAGGWGTGMLAGKVMGAIKQRGVAARMAVMEANDAARAGTGAVDAGAGGAGTGAAGGGAPGAPGAAGAGAAAPGAAAVDPLRFGQTTALGAGESLDNLAAGMAPGAPGLTREQTRLLGRGKELGFQMTPGTETGSLPLQQMEAGRMRSPWTSGLFEPMLKANKERLNGLAVRAIGEEGTELAPSVINSAHERIGGIFDDAAERVGTLHADGEALTGATRGLENIISESGAGAAITPEVGQMARRLADVWGEGGQITGERLMRERSKLVQRARLFSRNGDQLNADGVHDIIGVIDEVVAGSVPRAQRAAINEARAQWRILATMEKGAAIDPAGNVRAGALFEALKREFPREMRRGVTGTGTETGGRVRDLMDGVRVTQTFKNVVPDSGTATGMAMQGLEGNLLQKIIQGGVMRGLGGLYMGGGGRLAVDVARAQNRAPGLAAVLGGGGRGGVGGAGGIMGD